MTEDMTFEKIYPAGRLEGTRAVLRKFWKGGVRTVWSVYSDEFQYRQLEDLDEMVRLACLNIKGGAALPGMNIPRLAVDFGTVSTASYWGGRVRRSSSGNPWVDKVIHSPSDVVHMKHSDPCGGDVEKAYALWKRVSTELGTENLPCSTFDLQGPLNTLSLVWDQDDMMLSMYDEPETVQRALGRVTDVIIENIRCLLGKVPCIEAPLWPFIWLPPDIGIGITEDYMPLLSPKLYLEFGIPYIKRLSDEFKGLFIHCCGEFSQHIDSLVSSPVKIIGMEFVYPKIDIERLFRSFGGNSAFVPGIMDNHLEDFGCYTAYLESIERQRTEETRIWYILRPDLPDFSEQVRLMEVVSGEI